MTRSARLIGTRNSVRGTGGFAFSPWMPIDAVLWAVMLMAALWMRYDFSVSQLAMTLGMSRFYLVLLGVVALSWVAGWLAGLYRGRFIPGSLLETTVLIVVFVGASLVMFAGHIASGDYEGVPRSTPLVAGAFTILAALVLRSLVRRKELFGAGVAAGAEPVVVFGAGDGGRQLVGQLRRSPVSKFRPVAILDDDPAKQGLVVDGIRVRGTREHIAHFAHKLGAGTLLIAVPSLPGEELIDVRDRAEQAGLHVLVLPPIDSMMKARVAADELRGINVTDLLGRSPARLNQTQIAEYIRGKRVLVTGAGGSIGSELCRQLVRFRPGELMMLDRDESGLHSVQLSIQDQAMLDGEDTILASIRDREAVLEIFAKRRPQIVFHAAALKHMPLLEHYPLEALKTNVLGTLNLLDAAEASGVETFVNISTDKAASPSTSLGTSKRIAERLTAARAATAHNAKYASVRFGNVLGSRGSVLTVFEKQIKDGGPVTVTDPEVNRYFMTIPEACQLVLQAAVVGDSGDTLVLDMGEPVRIADVARTLIQQSGRDIEIVYTGLRANEKAAEELFDETEVPIAGKKHEALSQVRVPPIDLTPAELACFDEHEAARRWMEAHANPSTPIVNAR
ncbi:nucleoside-diphosphate sugar epimerase/dehydratase [Dietzia sp. B19]|uniref:nucleoside-diphosphate sugar epimerase/dehydratase n=1 Tax=Dietzia sp. B19 TaxID=1630632 RepID=UPI0015F9CEEF|nr:nucleoside-diphosphate sugar epimerase/dehydratase [Dietzia sp. B19]